jgi:predicted AlkP superfamily pyrophosphatase or phosphodiesterase
LAAQAPAEEARAERAPRLVLVIVVDQMRFDYLTRFAPLFERGFKQLLAHGAVFSHALYGHATSETGPGHAVILSGRQGRHSGIVANEWYDSLAGRRVNVVEDPVQRPVGGTGRGASPANFLGFTLGDVLKKTSPASKVVAVSLKDRAAVLLGGRRADGAYWYDPDTGRFITSTYYMPTAPAWLDAFNRERFADRVRRWDRLKPDEALYRRYAGEDKVAGEWDGVDNVFPHVVRGAPPEPGFYDDVRRTPFADEITLDVALQAFAADHLGEDEATDVLAVSFSATDIIGHTYGPDSQEAMDNMLRLDWTLGRLFDEVDRKVGRGRTVVALTADHGASPLVEVLRAKGVDARRAAPALFEEAVRRALAQRFPSADGLVASFDAPNVWLDLDRIHRLGLARGEVETVVSRALLSTGLVEKVYTHEQLMGDPPPGDPYFPLVQAAFFAPRSPHLFGVVRRYVYVGERPGGTGHGTAHDYDRHVPVVFMGAGVRPGTYDEPCGPEDIAPTLGALIGLDYPLQDAHRVLGEAVAR